ncbi:hypothetical protein ACFL6Y_05300 [Elusimicrobiota bacterium]
MRTLSAILVLAMVVFGLGSPETQAGAQEPAASGMEVEENEIAFSTPEGPSVNGTCIGGLRYSRVK